jgi:predicted Holliday junction resolvase-like endonuclease
MIHGLDNVPALVRLAGVLVSLCAALLFGLVMAIWRLRTVAARLADRDFQNRSLSSTYGRISEQWFPLMGAYPYDPSGFRFLGSPVDGIQFEEDRIVFVEFKANRSRLSASQKRFKRLVEDGYVYWEEFHFTDSGRSAVGEDAAED